MNIENATSQNSLLREMVKVKKLRFQDEETWKDRGQVTRDLLQRTENFREFRAVYEDAFHSKASEDSKEVHETRSGSLCRVPRIKPHHVETVNIELPPHYGGDRAVQLIENKLKPKKRFPKVSREVTTEIPLEHKPKKVVSFADTVKVEEPAANKELFTQTPSPVKEVKRSKSPRKLIKYKITCKPPVIAKPSLKKPPNHTKIMDALCDINEKLQKMQEKYFKYPRVQYRNVNDSFTQSGNVEILYANEKYPEQMTNKLNSPSHISQVILSDSKMKERIKEMNEMFPEFPKIEDTLKEIENHLDNIVKLNDNGASVEEELTADILKQVEQTKDQKLKSIRHQIDEVEDFCDKLSEMGNDDELRNASSESSVGAELQNSTRNVAFLPKKRSPRTYVNDCDDVNTSIKKSNFLSKEFGGNLQHQNPMVKIFSENKLAFWKDRMREIKNQNESRGVESVTKILDTFKFTFENSIYEPVTK